MVILLIRNIAPLEIIASPVKNLPGRRDASKLAKTSQPGFAVSGPESKARRRPSPVDSFGAMSIQPGAVLLSVSLSLPRIQLMLFMPGKRAKEPNAALTNPLCLWPVA